MVLLTTKRGRHGFYARGRVKNFTAQGGRNEKFQPKGHTRQQLDITFIARLFKFELFLLTASCAQWYLHGGYYERSIWKNFVPFLKTKENKASLKMR